MSSQAKKPSIGIDLGTTYSCVAVFQQGRVEVIANGQGSRITPSVVAFTEKGRIVGEGAEVHKTLDPENTIYSAKRFIGGTPVDSAVNQNKAKYPFKVLDNGETLKFEVEFQKDKLLVSPEEVSAAVLAHMKRIAEDFLEESVEEAVITVPGCVLIIIIGHVNPLVFPNGSVTVCDCSPFLPFRQGSCLI